MESCKLAAGCGCLIARPAHVEELPTGDEDVGDVGGHGRVRGVQRMPHPRNLHQGEVILASCLAQRSWKNEMEKKLHSL